MKNFSLFKHDPNFEVFPAGTTIFREGEPGKIMYVIKEGEVNILLKDQIVETAGEGEPLGEMALIEANAPRSATAIAKNDCKLVPINQKRFTFLIQQNPYFALEVMRVLAYRLSRMDIRVENSEEFQEKSLLLEE